VGNILLARKAMFRGLDGSFPGFGRTNLDRLLATMELTAGAVDQVVREFDAIPVHFRFLQ